MNEMFKTKIFRNVAVIFAIVYMVAAVAGCKNVVVDDSHYSGIVGTWEYTNFYGTSTYTFNADGSFSTNDSNMSNYKFWVSKKYGDSYVISFSEDGRAFDTLAYGTGFGGSVYEWVFRDGAVYYNPDRLTKR